ncbi:hypothetical protein PAJ65_09580, partial [Campylobacter coli]|uniref:hypothetical protein n=1 Tax=Campylobacter coli TaxID=195 RepID=UPI0025B1AD82
MPIRIYYSTNMPVVSHNEFYGAFVFQAYQLDPNCEYTRLQEELHCGYKAVYCYRPHIPVLLSQFFDGLFRPLVSPI